MECGSRSQTTVETRTMCRGPLDLLGRLVLSALIAASAFNDMTRSSNKDVGFQMFNFPPNVTNVQFSSRHTTQDKLHTAMSWPDWSLDRGPSVQYVALHAKSANQIKMDGGDIGYTAESNWISWDAKMEAPANQMKEKRFETRTRVS